MQTKGSGTMKTILKSARYTYLALLSLGIVMVGDSLVAEAASAEPWSPEAAGEALHYEPVFKDYQAMTHAPPMRAANGQAHAGHEMAGHEMAGHEMAGHEMTGHEMTGHEMTGHEMTGHEMTDAPKAPVDHASHHHH